MKNDLRAIRYRPGGQDSLERTGSKGLDQPAISANVAIYPYRLRESLSMRWWRDRLFVDLLRVIGLSVAVLVGIAAWQRL